ncbi:MAG: hypothetical protein ACRD63_01795 [Pyrinomonadaceae bacterium]
MAPVAPTRDFTRVANSITREAVPAGLFAGKGKQLYDYLYILTRGAIVPSRTIRISRTKLMAGAGIGSRVTFDANISRLSSVGLIEVRSIAGEHVGNEYTVYLPEERGLTSQTSSTSLTAGPVRHSHAHNPDRLVSPQTSQSMHTVNPVSTMVYEEPNTLFKTKYDDDKSYLFQELIIELLKACREITGVEPANNDAERQRWGMIGRTLVDELRDAARNTNNVTSIPAFLAAHLKRRFAKSSAEPARSGQREGRLQRPGSTPVSESAIADGASTVESRRLTESEIKNQAESLAELMKLGYSDEEASVQLAPQYSPEDWKSIMEEVHARLGGDKLEATEGN